MYDFSKNYDIQEITHFINIFEYTHSNRKSPGETAPEKNEENEFMDDNIDLDLEVFNKNTKIEENYFNKTI